MNLTKTAEGRGRLFLLGICVGITLVMVGAGIMVWDGKAEDNRAGFCWSLVPDSVSREESSLSACGDELETHMTGSPSDTAPSDTQHSREESRIFEKVITSYGRHIDEDPSLMPGEISKNMADSLVSYQGDVHEILGGTGKDSKTENDIHVRREILLSFIRGVANNDAAFRVVRESQFGYIARNIDGLDRIDFTEASNDGTDRAERVAREAGSVVGVLVQIRSQALRSGKNEESVDAETKKKLIDDYENNGFPRLRQMIHGRAQRVGVPRDEISESGGRVADITSWANTAYNAE